jgi:hypothetical protein
MARGCFSTKDFKMGLLGIFLLKKQKNKVWASIKDNSIVPSRKSSNWSTPWTWSTSPPKIFEIGQFFIIQNFNFLTHVKKE